MRRRRREDRLHGEQARRAVQGHAVKKSGIHRQPGRQRAINTRRTTLTGLIAMQSGMLVIVGYRRRLVTGRMGCRSYVRRRFGSLHNRHGKRAIGRAGNGKAKHDKAGKKRAHDVLISALPVRNQSQASYPRKEWGAGGIPPAPLALGIQAIWPNS